ncbi:MAG: hypothetical protein KJO43_05185 [Phycisphaerae bacterium]|nr:hypothetical protein [Phycisphaerae bacterium]
MSRRKRDQRLNVVWPDDEDAVEFELEAGRGTLELVDGLPPNMGILRTPTRLRIEVLDGDAPKFLRLRFKVSGESPLPRRARRLRRVTLDSLATLPDVPAGRLVTTGDPGTLTATNTLAIAADVQAADDCRRFYSESEDPVARARRFFYKVDQRTHQLWVPTEPFLPLVDQLQARLELHMEPPAVIGNMPGLTEQQHDDVCVIFEDAAAHLSLEEELTAYLWFAAGLLEHKCPHVAAAAGPDSANVLLMMELAFDALENAAQGPHDYWLTRLPTLIYMVEVFGRRVGEKLTLSMIEPELMRPSYAVSPLEIEADRAQFIAEAEADPNTKAVATLKNRFIIG